MQCKAVYKLCKYIPICTAINQSKVDFTFCTAQQRVKPDDGDLITLCSTGMLQQGFARFVAAFLAGVTVLDTTLQF